MTGFDGVWQRIVAIQGHAWKPELLLGTWGLLPVVADRGGPGAA